MKSRRINNQTCANDTKQETHAVGIQLSQLTRENTRLDHSGATLQKVSAGIGIAGLAFSFLLSLFFANGLSHFIHTYLVGFMYVLSLSLGALFFVMLHHLTRAGWSVVVRRLAEIIAANIPMLVLLFLPILFGLGKLYHWSHPEMVAADELLQGKSPFLNIPFFVVRCLIYFGVWFWLSRFFLSASTEQDESGDPEASLDMEKKSTYGMVLFALTLTFASLDWIMTLDAHWYSTIFGVYYFAGCALSFIALLIVSAYFLQRHKILTRVITTEHYHDFGKLLFGFIFFWAYIAFSQYMLIWYANIPEETLWIYLRQEGQWKWISLFLIFGHFAIPFLGLLSRYPKRRKKILLGWALWMLFAHYWDLYWLIMPNFKSYTVPFQVIDIACFIGIAGFYMAGIFHIAKDRSLLACKDPRLEESLSFENA
jgi:hypothetical protein